MICDCFGATRNVVDNEFVLHTLAAPGEAHVSSIPVEIFLGRLWDGWTHSRSFLSKSLQPLEPSASLTADFPSSSRKVDELQKTTYRDVKVENSPLLETYHNFSMLANIS